MDGNKLIKGQKWFSVMENLNTKLWEFLKTCWIWVEFSMWTALNSLQSWSSLAKPCKIRCLTISGHIDQKTCTETFLLGSWVWVEDKKFMESVSRKFYLLISENKKNFINCSNFYFRFYSISSSLESFWEIWIFLNILCKGRK